MKENKKPPENLIKIVPYFWAVGSHCSRNAAWKHSDQWTGTLPVVGTCDCSLSVPQNRPQMTVPALDHRIIHPISHLPGTSPHTNSLLEGVTITPKSVSFTSICSLSLMNVCLPHRGASQDTLKARNPGGGDSVRSCERCDIFAYVQLSNSLTVRSWMHAEAVRLPGPTGRTICHS